MSGWIGEAMDSWNYGYVDSWLFRYSDRLIDGYMKRWEDGSMVRLIDDKSQVTGISSSLLAQGEFIDRLLDKWDVGYNDGWVDG